VNFETMIKVLIPNQEMKQWPTEGRSVLLQKRVLFSYSSRTYEPCGDDKIAAGLRSASHLTSRVPTGKG